jgi:hypothetical protein
MKVSPSRPQACAGDPGRQISNKKDAIDGHVASLSRVAARADLDAIVAANRFSVRRLCRGKIWRPV